MRTNCDNCGAVLSDGKCEYCGTEWFKPGIHLGDHAYVSRASITEHTLHRDAGRGLGGQMYLGHGTTEYEVELNVIGLTREEVQRLVTLIRGGLGPIDMRV